MPEQVTAGFQLSPQQRRLCGLKAEGASALAHLALLLEGPLDRGRLQAAVTRLVENHEILRTTFQRSSGMKFPFQVVNANAQLGWEEVDLSSCDKAEQERRVQELTSKTSDMDPESMPTLRSTLAVCGKERHVLILRLPALCADSVSLRILAEQSLSLYAGEPSPAAEALQYADYSEWQNELQHNNDEESQAAERYWSRHEPGSLPAVALAFERKSQARVAAARESLPVAGVGSDAIQCPAGQALPDFLLACWQTLVWRMSGQSEIVLGVADTGRTHEELQNSVGVFVRALPLYANFESAHSVAEQAAQVKRQRRENAEYQDYFSLENSEFAVGFSVEEQASAQSAAGLKFSVLSHSGDSFAMAMELRVRRMDQSWTTELVFDGARFTREATEQIARRFAILVSAAARNPEQAPGSLPIMDLEERRRVTEEFNRTAAAFPADKCIHHIFEEVAARWPQRQALRFGEQEFSYAELNARANQVAHFLRKHGVKANVPVGLCMERSAEMIVGLLGILKAGGCYVPLVPDNPRSRLAHQLAETGAPAVVTQQTLVERLPDFGGIVVALDGDAASLANESSSNPAPINGPEDLVYVIYTSGSTGTPKGVAVRHCNLANYTHFICQRLKVAEHRNGLHFATVSTISADLGNTCIFPSLVSGGCLHVIGFEMAMAANLFAGYAAQHPIDVLKITPSHLNTLLNAPDGERALPKKYLVLGGEASTWHLIDRVRKECECKILNHYGPTETTVGCCTFGVWENEVSAWAPATVPIGKPIANDAVYILDAQLEPVPVGVAGELCIGGTGVAQGYWNQPQQTAERFVRDPFSREASARIYRSGDLARFLPDGNIEFMGRIDHQVKIRGFRVEPAEVEAVLKQHPSVRQSVLVPYDDSGEKRLAAYVVGAKNPTTEELRSFLSQRLPEYMIPSAFVYLETLPLNANGKVDLQALPSVADSQAKNSREFAPARNADEEKLIAIWTEVLKLERVGIRDNFFELGGHSLLATQIISRIRKAFRVQMPLHSFLETPTVAGLAEKIPQCPAAESEEEELARLLQELDGISDEEAERLLSSETPKNPNNQS
jgi:amino acid adenylation domain-containing protein